MAAPSQWDVVVVGSGPAGSAAAYAAASAGARVLVLERGQHPRYKTCGGGLISLALANLPGAIDVPVLDEVVAATFTRNGARGFTRVSRDGPIVSMVLRAELDQALLGAAVKAGAQVREQVTVRGFEPVAHGVEVVLAGSGRITAAVVVGADGSAGVSAHYVGVEFDQEDLGLELELAVPPAIAGHWHHRLLIDWGPLPGSYGWVFPKRDRLTVGVIAARGQAAATKAYLRSFVEQLGLSELPALHDSGHMTRCRAEDSPVRRGAVLVAGDAAGLLEPWTREGISFALRSGALAGAAAATGDLAGYETAVRANFAAPMRAGRALLAVFRRRPLLLHTVLATPPGWRLFTGFCRGETPLESVYGRRPVRALLALLS